MIVFAFHQVHHPQQSCPELGEAKATFAATAEPARSIKELDTRTRDSWSRGRCMVAKAEHLEKHPAVFVTSLPVEQIGGPELCETIHRANAAKTASRG